VAQVKFLPSETVVEVTDEQSLLSAALQADIAIATACGGVANCTECKVEVLQGAENLSDMEYIEESKLGNVFYITHERLACQTRVCGPVTVRVLKEQLADKRMRARTRALRRTKENLARKAGRQTEEVRRRLALLNDDGEGAEVEGRDARPSPGPRPPRAPRHPRAPGPETSAGAPQSSAESGGAVEPPKPKSRRRRRRKPADKKSGE
jgi:ferredoxin